MSQWKLPRITTSDRTGFTPDQSEILFDTDLDRAYIGDGSTAGGLQLAVGGSAVTDGDKGDITVSGGGVAWTIDAGAVTDGKLRDSTGLSVIGRSANTSGDPGDIVAATDGHVLRRSGTSLGFGLLPTTSLSGTLQTAQFPALTGDVTTAGGSLATTIAADAVTFAKMQNIATAKFLGRTTAGTGDIELLDIQPVMLSNSYNDLDDLPTLGTMAAEDAGDYSPTSAFADIAFSGDYADLINVPPLGPADTDDLPEGATNLYYTDERVDDRVAALIQNGTGISWTYDDGAGTLTGNVSITQYTDEMAQDAAASLIQNGTGITWSYNDGANTLTPTVTITQYTDELAQDAVGAMIDSTLNYVDGTPLLQRAALTGAVTASAGSNSTSLGSFTKAQLDTAVSDGNVLYVGDVTQYTDEMSRDAIGAALVEGAGIDITVDDGADTITIASTVTQYTDEMVDDRVAALLVAGTDIDLTYDDTANTLTIDYIGTGGGGGGGAAQRKESFEEGVDFDALDTTLTLTETPLPTAKDHITIYFDGAFQGEGEWSWSSPTITFTSGIPAGVNKVEVQWLYATGSPTGVVTVTGLDTDNTDPLNPVVQIAVDGVTITGDGTPGDPLVAASGGGTWGSITGTLSSQTDLQTALNGKLGTTLNSAQIFVGNGSNVATGVAVSGDVSMANTGAATVISASDTVAGKVELATTAETNTGTDTARAVTPDGLAGSYAGTKSVSISVTAPTENTATGDGKAYITIPEALNGMNLVRATATVVTAGTTNATTIQIYNVTQTADMLSGLISIASGGTVATAGTIDTANDDVATNDVLRVDVDTISTTPAKGLMVILEFRLP